MFCKNCGANVQEKDAFCKACGAKVETDSAPIAPAENTPVEAPPAAGDDGSTGAENAALPAATQPADKKKRTRFKDLPPKEKKKRGIIGGACLLLALILILSDAFGGGGSGDMVIQTGEDDLFGGTAFNLTLDEFIDKYNQCIYDEEENDSIRQLYYIKKSDFSTQEMTAEGFHIYSYKFRNIFDKSGRHTRLDLTVKDSSQRICAVEYTFKMSDDSDYLLRQTPSIIFQFFDSSICHKVGDYSDYLDLVQKVTNKGGKYYHNAVLQEIIPLNEDDTSVLMAACTKESEFYEKMISL